MADLRLSSDPPAFGWVMLVDDVRRFRDDRGCLLARTAKDALGLLRRHRRQRIAELWLDHDLGRDAAGRPLTVMPVVAELAAAAAAGDPYRIGVVYVHTANPTGAVAMRSALAAAGYEVQRHHAPIWRHHHGS